MVTTPQRNPIDRLSVFIGVVLLSGFGDLMYEISSQFSYMLGRSYHYGEGAQGDFIAAFFTGYSLIAVSMVFWVRRVDWRLIAFGSAVAAAVGFSILLTVPAYLPVMACMFVAGVGMGSCYALSLTIFGDSSNPTRAYGVKFFFDVVPGALFNLVFPSLFATYAFHGVIAVIVGFAVLIMATSVLLPRQGTKTGSEVAGGISIKDDGLALVACFSCFVLILGVMALWAFLGQIGVHKGFAMSSLGTMLAVGSALNACGALVAAVVGNRFGQLAPVAVTITLNIGMLVLIGATGGFVPFAIGALVFCLTNNYTLAYTMAMVANIDRRGRLIPFASACFSAGAIFGPALAGHLLESGGVGPMLVLPAVAWLIAWLTFARVYKVDRRAQTALTASA
jgi:predicted MFS family arabinose efflux permease